MSHVTALSVTPVKGLRLAARDELQLGRAGVHENRRFFLVDERQRMVNGKHLGALNTVVPDYDDAERRLTLTFADGSAVSGAIELGESLVAQMYSRPLAARLVLGPFAGALSAQAGKPLRLVEAEQGAVDRGRRGSVSLISRASLERLADLADLAGREHVDARRFRMLVEVDGVAPHAEDSWVGQRVRVGGALVAMHGHVGRCLVTTRNPESGQVDLPTLELLSTYRRALDTTEPLAFGIYGEVLEPGTVRIGDVVAPA
jgi:uncharacterized protein YcbX